MKFWSRKWISSKQPRKQRKYRYNAPLHVKHKFLCAHLSKELIKKYNRRSFPVRKGDEVEIMRGEFKKKKGKISRVGLKKTKIYIDGITRKKVDGSEVMVPVHPSNLRIINLELNDEKRLKALKRSMKEEKHEKTSKKIAGSKVLASAKKSKEMGSKTKARPAQKT